MLFLLRKNLIILGYFDPLLFIRFVVLLGLLLNMIHIRSNSLFILSFFGNAVSQVLNKNRHLFITHQSIVKLLREIGVNLLL